MDQLPGSLGTGVLATMKRPSAFLPLVMSLIALSMVLVDVAMYGRGPAGDNETLEHLWQLLMVGQAPVIVYFAIRWLPQSTQPTLYVLAAQVIAALASLSAVLFFNLG